MTGLILRIFEKFKQAASCEGEGFKRVKVEKFEVGKVRSWKRSKLEKIDVTKVRSWKCSKIIINVAYTNWPISLFKCPPCKSGGEAVF